MKRPRELTRRPAGLAQLLALGVTSGLGLAAGALEGFVLAAHWAAHVIMPGGNGAPGPEVVPVLASGLLGAVLGAAVGAVALGALASLLLHGLYRLRRLRR